MRHDSDGVLLEYYLLSRLVTNYVEGGVALARTTGYNGTDMQFTYEVQ